MSRDYKSQTDSTGPSKRRNFFLLGLFIGYALGLISAIVIWVYINQTPSPFTSKEVSTGGIAANSPSNKNQKIMPVPNNVSKSADVKNDKPRFEFYGILSDSEELITEQQLEQTTHNLLSEEKYYLQVGLFQSTDDADNLKAKIAMFGIEAFIQSTNLPGKGMWHRVRIGPLKEINDSNQIRASLKKNGIEASFVKIREKIR